MPRLNEARPRSSYLGATDIAAVAGVSPYRTPFEVYLEKIGELDPAARETDVDRDRKERGHRFEDVALDWYAEANGIAIERVRRDIVHREFPFIVVHPDARVRPWRPALTLIEAKTGPRRWDALPQHVEAQVQMQMAATGAERAVVALQTFDGPPYPYEVERNPELIGALTELAVAFWHRVLHRSAPPVDPSPAANRFLDRMWRDGPPMTADADQRALLARLLEIRAEVKRLEAEEANLVIVLKQSMHGAARLQAPGVGTALWTPPTERRTTAWKAVAEGYRAAITELAKLPGAQPLLDGLGMPDPETFESLHSRTEEGVRQFRPTPWKNQEATAA